MDGFCVVEWGDKFPELMPGNIRWLEIKLLDDEKRLITEVIEP